MAFNFLRMRTLIFVVTHLFVIQKSIAQLTGEISLYDVELKSKPSFMNDQNPVITHLQRGDVVYIVSRDTKDWYKVRTEHGNGWVYKSSIEILKKYPAELYPDGECKEITNSLFSISDWQKRFVVNYPISEFKCNLFDLRENDRFTRSKLSYKEIELLFGELVPGDEVDTGEWYLLSRQANNITLKGNIEILLLHQTWGNEIYYVTLNKCGQVLNAYNIATCNSDGGDVYIRETKFIDAKTIMSRVHLDFDNAGIYKNIIELYKVYEDGEFEMIHYEYVND